MSKIFTTDKINSAINFLETSMDNSHNAEANQNYLTAIYALKEKRNRIGAQERFGQLFVESDGCFGAQMTINDIGI